MTDPTHAADAPAQMHIATSYGPRTRIKPALSRTASAQAAESSTDIPTKYQPQRLPAALRMKAIIKPHIDAFDAELSPAEAALLMQLPPEDAAAMFAVWLCDTADFYMSSRQADVLRRSDNEKEIKQLKHDIESLQDKSRKEIELRKEDHGKELASLREMLAHTEAERDAWRRKCLQTEAQNISIRNAYSGVMKDMEKLRRRNA
jgi:hypothetical protein